MKGIFARQSIPEKVVSWNR